MFLLVSLVSSAFLCVTTVGGNIISSSYKGSKYDSIKQLQDSIFSSGSYSTNLRPVWDQTDPLVIDFTFSLVAVVSLDNVKQELITNGFLFMFWSDTRNTWDPADYGGVFSLTPTPKEMWRPRLLLINTLGKRDPFEDDYSHAFFSAEGEMGWVPGGLFHTYCALNMEKFPFDIQDCKLQMCPMSHTNTSIQFEAERDVNLAFYYPNPGWELIQANVATENVSVVPTQTFSCPTVSFKLKRRSTTIVLNVIIPVIFLSVLNNLVFLIPVDSGEKISYAITVLLALTVFLSMVSTMTPRVSDVIPALTIYLFVLLLSSVLTVAAAILSVYLHNSEEREESSINNRFKLQQSVNKLTHTNRAVSPFDDGKDRGPDDSHIDTATRDAWTKVPGHDPYRVISRHLNKLFFVIMTMVTVICTSWYFIYTNT